VNVMLTRNPDGTVNAEPGDAVEVWMADYPTRTWYPCVLVTSRMTMNNDHVVVRDADGTQWVASLAHVRHARGGAGHLRLQVARLREVVERVQRDDLLNPDFYKQWLTAAIDDIERYECMEPEA
jgi:hypothetical protein